MRNGFEGRNVPQFLVPSNDAIPHLADEEDCPDVARSPPLLLNSGDGIRNRCSRSWTTVRLLLSQPQRANTDFFILVSKNSISFPLLLCQNTLALGVEALPYVELDQFRH
jgi:hypothetical protein